MTMYKKLLLAFVGVSSFALADVQQPVQQNQSVSTATVSTQQEKKIEQPVQTQSETTAGATTETTAQEKTKDVATEQVKEQANDAPLNEQEKKEFEQFMAELQKMQEQAQKQQQSEKKSV